MSLNFEILNSFFNSKKYKLKMKKIFLTGLLIVTTFFVYSQNVDTIINAKEVERIEKTLSSDAMRGRRTFTPDIDRAADFIANEFKAIGLKTWNNSENYRQEFSMVRSRLLSVTGKIDGINIDPKNIAVMSCQPEVKVDQASGYEVVSIKAGKNLFRETAVFIRADKNLIVLVDTSYATDYSRLSSGRRAVFKTDKNIVLILTNSVPENFTIDSHLEITEQKLANVVGILPGKRKKDEYVIFSAHYDHLRHRQTGCKRGFHL